MILATVQFGSIAPAINPLRLSEGAAQTAENCILTEGGLQGSRHGSGRRGDAQAGRGWKRSRPYTATGRKLDSETNLCCKAPRT